MGHPIFHYEKFKFKVALVFYVILAASFCACSDDNDDSPKSESGDLIGLWELESQAFWNSPVGEIGEIPTPRPVSSKGGVRYNSNGTGVWYYDYSRPSLDEPFHWKYKDGKILKWYDGETEADAEISKVNSLTSDMLVIESHGVVDGDYGSVAWHEYSYYRKVVED